MSCLSITDPHRPPLHLPLTDAHFRSCHPVRPERLSFILTPYPSSPPSITVSVAYVRQYVCICLIKATRVKWSQFQGCRILIYEITFLGVFLELCKRKYCSQSYLSSRVHSMIVSFKLNSWGDQNIQKAEEQKILFCFSKFFLVDYICVVVS